MDSPVLIQAAAAVFGLLFGLICYRILYGSSRNNNRFLRTLLVMALVTVVVYWAADIYVLTRISEGERSLFSIVFIGLFHSLELFVFQTHFFDNGYQEFFFGSNGVAGHPWMAYMMVITFVMACFVSTSLVIKAFNRRRLGRVWLSEHKAGTGPAHVFFLGGEIPTILARDIKKRHPDHPCIFVGYPDPEVSYMDLSIWEKIQRLFQSRDEDDNGPFDTVVYSRVPLASTTGTDICRQMNLDDLEGYLKNPSCKVYLLSENEEENMRCTENLYRYGCLAEIYCRGRRDGLNRMYEDAMAKTPSVNIHLVGPSYLAVRNMKNDPELLPVRYVGKGKDSQGRMEGWVDTPFNALILGFGETGREALGFVYEYGAFVGKDFRKSPFSCVVMDRRMDNLDYDYRKSFPGMNEAAGVCFRQCEIGSNEFWSEMAERLPGLNYVVVALGSDQENLRVAIDLVEYAYRNDKDLSRNFVILAAQESPSRLDEITLNHFNSIGQFHACIRTFGLRKDVWTYDNITNESLTARAKNYMAGYERAQGYAVDPDAVWQAREKLIIDTPDYALHAKRVRQRAQDYANCFHVTTKKALVGPEIWDVRKEIAECIPADYDKAGTHYTGTDPHVEKVLHYLAVQEHFRWEASHVAMGYTPGSQTNEVKKTHACIMDYDDLTPKVQHYDYLVVKTTFDL